MKNIKNHAENISEPTARTLVATRFWKENISNRADVSEETRTEIKKLYNGLYYDELQSINESPSIVKYELLYDEIMGRYFRREFNVSLLMAEIQSLKNELSGGL